MSSDSTAPAGATGEQAFSSVIREAGGAAYEDQVRQAQERATRIGEFEIALVPGTLQTADYARGLLGVTSGLKTWDASETAVEDKVRARMRRQEVLRDPGKRVQVVLSEAALRTLIVPAPVLAGQLGKLLSVLRLPSVELRIIGFGQEMPVYPFGFRLYDDQLAVTESIAGERNYTAGDDPDEVAAFAAAFTALRRAASTGGEAEAIIRKALDDLRNVASRAE